MNKRLLVGLKYGLALGLLALAVWGNADVLRMAVDQPILAMPLVVGMLIELVALLLRFGRWFVLVRGQGLPFTLRNALRLGMIGYFLGIFFPGGIGGDVVKAAFLAREQSRRTTAVATVVMDRAIGLLGLFWLVAVTGAFFWMMADPCLENPTLRGLVIGSLGVALGSVLAWFLMGLGSQRMDDAFVGRLQKIPKVGGSLVELWVAAWLYRRNAGCVVGALALAVISHIGMAVRFYLAAHVFEEPNGDTIIPTLTQHFLIVPVGLTVQALAPVPGGAGVGELGFGALYFLMLNSAAGQARGVLASLMVRVTSWGLALVGMVFYLGLKPPTRCDEKREQRDGSSGLLSASAPATTFRKAS